MFKTYSPYTLFADAATADAPAARRFNGLVESYLQTKDETAKKALIQWLQKWQQNHEQVQALIPGSPVLKSIEGLSENLSAIAELGLQALETPATKELKQKQALELLEKAREQGGRTELQVVDAIEKLITAKTASVGG